MGRLFARRGRASRLQLLQGADRAAPALVLHRRVRQPVPAGRPQRHLHARGLEPQRHRAEVIRFYYSHIRSLCLPFSFWKKKKKWKNGLPSFPFFLFFLFFPSPLLGTGVPLSIKFN